ncbi:lysophospholipid acyltransferase family protein [Streptomyces sp. WI04-05B]|uniref:lysophospholipid acyltransferase family protein n=1 Tax=Streptomyces TaxID=1883 RepID=UPI0029B777BC|nr:MULTISPECIES: lysophospholipid acyltransferase family protein [unclassified Streptomyces]MDX2541891.1 lysophospholipid acyltransferase family protein [Streptomyces sp. WI04-05B]MDX2586973.1 lysophospholipid acyltransferase family protein [Streptomyces sp. WI04-05A]MDX3749941.1 lysophospholipid acyltransferase family protein [Streptomyces sp. AK08-02]
MPSRRIGFWYRLAAVICKPPLVLLIKRDWRGMEHIPAAGGFITAVNHNSHADPFAYGHYQYNSGRVPRFLAKSGLFKKGFSGVMMRGTGQIPVYRETTDALSAFRAAIDAVERGECVVFYPEGTITRDPDQWPMTGKTGAARVALQTKCPVIPVAQWGANELLPPYSKKVNVLPRKTHHVLAGPPVDLTRFYDREMSPDLLKEATEVIMAAVTRQLEVIRGGKAPATPYDPRRERIEQRRRTAEEEAQDALDAQARAATAEAAGEASRSRTAAVRQAPVQEAAEAREVQEEGQGK